MGDVPTPEQAGVRGGTVGIVVVSHSRPLAEAAVALALEMVQVPPPLAVAAGLDDGGFGTDAVAVSGAIEGVASDAGVLVLTDLGSAVLSAEMALEFLPDPSLDVRIVAAPFVEGLIAAVVSAAAGAPLDEVAPAAAGALAGKIEQLGGVAESDDHSRSLSERSETKGGDPEDTPPDASATVTIVNPLGLHARPAAAVAAAAASFDAAVTIAVPGRTPASAVSPLSLASLGTRGGDAVTISATGSAAAAAVVALQGLIATGFGEAEDTAAQPVASEPAPRATHPIGVSPGRVVGPVARMTSGVAEPDHNARVNDRDAAVAKLHAAISAVATDLRARAEDPTTQQTAREVLQATAALAADPAVAQQAEALVRDNGQTPESAIWQTLGGVAEQFTALGGLQAERVTDVHDIRARIVAALTGVSVGGVPAPGHPFVLVARDLAPADTAGLDPATCLAILTSEGGRTSHTAILARSLGIPAVVAAPLAATLTEGTLVLVDGTTGEVVENPSDELTADARTTGASAEITAFVGPGQTADGEPVYVLANVGKPADTADAVAAGAEGVGLFRTEFCFLDRTEAPSHDEQVAAYRAVLDAFAGQHVVVRTLDAGSDKPLPFLTPAGEENPALGVRGYRTAGAHPEVLDGQLAAIAEAAQGSNADVWVMAPMIATAAEAADFAARARAVGLSKVGVMVETPAAALSAAEIFEHVDFVSIGTNDLGQYTMAADRLSGALADLNDPWQPAVLRLISLCVAGSGGRSVGVCGEAASDPLLAQVLVGLGVRSLSMTPRLVPAVGAAVGAATLEQCRAMADAALGAASASDARAAASALAPA